MVSFPPVSQQDPIHPPLSPPIHTTCPAHLILLDFITGTGLGEEYKSFSSSLCNLLHSPVTSSLLCQNILLNTMFSYTLSFLSSCSVNDQVSHPYKTTGKIIVLYVYIIRLHFEIITVGTTKLELTCTIDEDKWGSGGTAPLIRNTALD